MAWFLNQRTCSGNSVCFVVDDSVPRELERVGRYGGIRPGEEQYMEDLPVQAPSEALLMGAQTVSPFNGSGDWVCVKPEHWLFAGTGMAKGDRRTWICWIQWLVILWGARFARWATRRHGRSRA